MAKNRPSDEDLAREAFEIAKPNVATAFVNNQNSIIVARRHPTSRCQICSALQNSLCAEEFFDTIRFALLQRKSQALFAFQGMPISMLRLDVANKKVPKFIKSVICDHSTRLALHNYYIALICLLTHVRIYDVHQF